MAKTQKDLSQNRKRMFKITCSSFQDLSVFDLYDILRLRQAVFVVEQNCPYLDCDDKDQASHHLCIRNEAGQLLAYTRLLPEGLSFPGYVSIGRVLSAPEARGRGIGQLLMTSSIAQCSALFGPKPIKIGAQTYLLRFYESFGFRSTGEEYLEDGIPHTKMLMC